MLLFLVGGTVLCLLARGHGVCVCVCVYGWGNEHSWRLVGSEVFFALLLKVLAASQIAAWRFLKEMIVISEFLRYWYLYTFYLSAKSLGDIGTLFKKYWYNLASEILHEKCSCLSADKNGEDDSSSALLLSALWIRSEEKERSYFLSWVHLVHQLTS